jgi:hypothetical protein
MSIHQYFDNLSRALMEFQYLEGYLKFYIRDCDRIIQKSVKDSFHYSVREKDINKMPLGRLIDEFSRRSNRKDIISVLKKLNKHRIHVAHTACLFTIEEQENSERMKELSHTITKVTKAVQSCIKELICEYSRVTNKPIPEEIFDQI